MLEIAAAWPEHQYSLNILLEAAFEVFPDRDYCVLCLPSDEATFPIIMQVFTRVPHRSSSNFDQTLYVAHRSAVLGKTIAGRE